jgi:hypothetical protein
MTFQPSFKGHIDVFLPLDIQTTTIELFRIIDVSTHNLSPSLLLIVNNLEIYLLVNHTEAKKFRADDEYTSKEKLYGSPGGCTVIHIRKKRTNACF